MQTTATTSRPPGQKPGSAVWLEPGLLLCYSPAIHTETAVRAYYHAMHASLADYAGSFVLVSDTRHIVRLPSGRMRRLHAELAATLHAPGKSTCIHSITIVEGPAMRAMLRVVLWLLRDAARPNEVAASFEDALRIARQKLAASRS